MENIFFMLQVKNNPSSLYYAIKYYVFKKTWIEVNILKH